MRQRSRIKPEVRCVNRMWFFFFKSCCDIFNNTSSCLLVLSCFLMQVFCHKIISLLLIQTGSAHMLDVMEYKIIAVHIDTLKAAFTQGAVLLQCGAALRCLTALAAWPFTEGTVCERQWHCCQRSKGRFYIGHSALCVKVALGHTQ